MPEEKKEVKTCIVCAYCKKQYLMGSVHACVVEVIDLDGTPKKLRKAVVKSKIAWLAS